MSTLFPTVLLAAVTQNLVLNGLLGICPLLALSRRHEVATGMAAATLVVLPLVCIAGYLLQVWVLRPLAAEYLTLILWALIFSTIAVAGERGLRRAQPVWHERFGVYLPLFGVNCLVLGAVLLSTAHVEGALHAFAYALGTAAGYAVVLLVLSSLRERLEMTPLPAAMRGAPAVLVTLGLFALAMLGLHGIG